LWQASLTSRHYQCETARVVWGKDSLGLFPTIPRFASVRREISPRPSFFRRPPAPAHLGQLDSHHKEDAMHSKSQLPNSVLWAIACSPPPERGDFVRRR